MKQRSSTASRQQPATGQRSGRLRAARVLVLALCAVLLGAPAQMEPAAAQSAPALELTAVDHDPRGRLNVSVQTNGEVDLAALPMTALLDGVPYEVAAGAVELAPPLSVVLAIDTSGSMSGAPMAAARDAAIALVERLRPEDEVAVLAFSDEPVLLQGFTQDKGLARGVLAGLAARGNTALYGAVDRAAEQLAAAGENGALVLLSDGQDYGGVSAASREDSIEAIVGSGARAFAFALGEADVPYLAEVVERTSGTLWEVSDESALTELFEELGGRLGATGTLSIEVPPLALGEHELVLRVRDDDGTSQLSRSFTVSNPGFLQVEPVAAEAADQPIGLRAETLVASKLVRIAGFAGDRELAVIPGASPRVLVDPWEFAPGELRVRVEALSSGAVLARSEHEVIVPPLEPRLVIGEVPEGGEVPAVARAQVQPGVDVVLAALADGEELARSAGEELTLEPPAGARSLRVELRGGDGAVIAAEEFAIEAAAAGSGGLPIPLVLAIVAVVGGGAFVVVRRRRGSRRERVREPARVLNRPRPAPTGRHGRRESPRFGSVIVTQPDGEERVFALDGRPLTVGSSPDCDIVIDGEDVRPVHLRISARGPGNYQVHGVRPRTARPYQGRHDDEWLVVRGGEVIQIGGHYLRVEQVEAPAAS